MSLSKLVALSLAVAKGTTIPRKHLAKTNKRFFKEINKQLANAHIIKSLKKMKKPKTRRYR